MRTIIIGFLLILGLLFGGVQGVRGIMGFFDAPDTNIDPNRYVYAAHSVWDGQRDTTYLSQIDLETNDIVKEILLPHRYAFLNQLADGSLLLGYSRDGTVIHRIVDRYTPGKSKVEKLIRTKDHGPSLAFEYAKNYFVLLGSSDGGKLVLEKYNRKHRFEHSFLLHPTAMSLYGCQALYFDDHQLLFFADLFGANFKDKPSLIFFDLKNETIDIQESNFGRYFESISSTASDKKNKRIFIGANVKPKNPDSENSHYPDQENHEIFVFSYPDIQFIDRFDTGIQPTKIAYASAENKLYVSNGLKVVVVDTSTNTIITTLPFKPFRMEYVGHGKLLLSHTEHVFGNHPKTGLPTTLKMIQKLVLIDTKTDTVIKEFPGAYGPISRRVY